MASNDVPTDCSMWEARREPLEICDFRAHLCLVVESNRANGSWRDNLDQS